METKTLDVGGKYNMVFLKEGPHLVLRIHQDLFDVVQKDFDILFKKQPMSDEQLTKIIEDQSCLMGWKVPPTRQVARAVGQWHGIEE